MSALLAEHEPRALLELFQHLATLHHRILLRALTAYHLTSLLPTLIDHAWDSSDNDLFLAVLEDLLRSHLSHVQFAAQCSELIQTKLHSRPLPNLETLIQYKHVTALVVIGLLRQCRTHTDSVNYPLSAAQTLTNMRGYFVAEISLVDHVTLTPLSAIMAEEFIELARDMKFKAVLESVLPWLYNLIIEQSCVTCLITCWTREHWPLYCTLGALIAQHWSRDHPICTLFRASVEHVLLDRAKDSTALTSLVSDHVTAQLRHNVLDLQHVTELLALVELLCGHHARR